MYCDSCSRSTAQKFDVVKKQKSRREAEKAVFQKSQGVLQGEAAATDEMMHVMTGPSGHCRCQACFLPCSRFPELAIPNVQDKTLTAYGNTHKVLF